MSRISIRRAAVPYGSDDRGRPDPRPGQREPSADSAKKEERHGSRLHLKAFRRWQAMTEPHWPNVSYPPIDYQGQVYYSAPKTATPLGSLDDVDPKLLETYTKLGIPLNEQKLLAGVAVDAVFDSVSVGTTYKAELAKQGIVFCSFGEAVREHPDLVQKYWAPSCPTATLLRRAELRRLLDGSFGTSRRVKARWSSAYFRINAENTGSSSARSSSRRGSSVSYWRGARRRALDDAAAPAVV